MSQRASPLALVVLILAVLFAISPFFSPGFGGYEPQQFPVEREDWPFMPAGWAFSIWLVIYLWLIIGAGWGLLRAKEAPDWQAMRLPLAVSLGVGIFWLYVATKNPIAASLMIWLMGATAIVAMLRASDRDPWFQRHPVAIYAGWLTAAGSVSLGLMLGGYGLTGPVMAGVIALGAGLIVALAVQRARPAEWAYPLPIVWALIAIIVNNLTGAPAWLIIALAAVGIALLVAQAWRARAL